MFDNVNNATIAATNKARIAYFENLNERTMLMGFTKKTETNPKGLRFWVAHPDFEKMTGTSSDEYTEETIQPEEMKIGDCMKSHHGFIYKITEIICDTHLNSTTPVYVAIGTYVGGDLEMYEAFLHDNQNGCAKSHFTSQQGNSLANWTRVNFV